MSTATPAELSRLRVAVLEKLYPSALVLRLTPGQVDDLANRCVASGKVFLTHDDRLSGYEISDLIETLKDDPANTHIFKNTEEPKKATSTGDDFQKRFGMSKAEFDRLPARKRLELANQEAFK
jgi:Villin headpiece domain